MNRHTERRVRTLSCKSEEVVARAQRFIAHAEAVERERSGTQVLPLINLDADTIRAEASAFQTTLSGHTYATRIPKWRAAGYTVKLIFLSLANSDEAVARVAMRVRQGGHDVPANVIRRRFAIGMRNFLEIYRGLVDYWQLFDNSGPLPRLLEEGVNR